MLALKEHFSRFFAAAPGRLHFAAHSHHPWPDVSYGAHDQAWEDAVVLADDKWDKIFGEIVPEAQEHLARRLGLSDPGTVAFAPNTHEFIMRLLSCLPTPTRILTTDAEFHSFARQLARLEEEPDRVKVTRVPSEPFGAFPQRLVEAAAGGEWDLVFFSQVMFDSAYAVPDPAGLVRRLRTEIGAEPFIVVDGYHGFMALPTDLGGCEDSAFYVGGGYKYAMAGESAGYLHAPRGYAERPVNTGWFAGFGALTSFRGGDPVGYGDGGMRLLGATLDPTGLYRFNAVQRWLDEAGVGVDAIHDHALTLQSRFLERLDGLGLAALSAKRLVPAVDEVDDRGNFLTFSLDDAGGVYQALHDAGVVTDYRADRLRFGFGIYHDEADVDELCARAKAALR